MAKPKMVDMEFTKKERENYYGGMAAPAEKSDSGPHYPWGLQLRLEKPELDKLGMKELPKIGAEMYVCARVRVTEVASAFRDQGNDSKVVSLQVTHLELSDKEPEEAA